MNEVLFERGNVRIDHQVVKIGSRSYSLSEYTAVDIRRVLTETSPRGDAFLIWWLLSSASVFMGLAVTRDSPNKMFLAVYGLIAIAFFSLGLRQWRKRKLISEDSLSVTLSSPTGETHLLVSSDRDYVEELRVALDRALTRQYAITAAS